jgi:hypothetical protein
LEEIIMKDSTKKLLKALACMAGCAAISGAAGKGMDFAKDKIVNGGNTEPDDGYKPDEAEATAMAEQCDAINVEEINEAEEVEKEEEN